MCLYTHLCFQQRYRLDTDQTMVRWESWIRTSQSRIHEGGCRTFIDGPYLIDEDAVVWLVGNFSPNSGFILLR